MEPGVDTFGDVHRDPRTGTTISSDQRVRNLLEEMELADQVAPVVRAEVARRTSVSA